MHQKLNKINYLIPLYFPLVLMTAVFLNILKASSYILYSYYFIYVDMISRKYMLIFNGLDNVNDNLKFSLTRQMY